MEDVVRVEGGLDLLQSCVLWTVCVAHAILVILGHEVHVASATCGVWKQCGPVVADPRTLGIEFIRRWRGGRDIDRIAGVARPAKGRELLVHPSKRSSE